MHKKILKLKNLEKRVINWHHTRDSRSLRSSHLFIWHIPVIKRGHIPEDRDT